MASWLKECDFVLVLNPRRSSKMGVEPFLFVWCFVSNLVIPAIAMASGSKESESHVFSRLFGSLCLNSCMLVPIQP